MLPFVVEPEGGSHVRALQELLAQRARWVRDALNQRGAILFRGFDIGSERDFEDVARSIEGFRPMTDYFMAEPGRHRVEGTSFVFYTNALVKTGGHFHLGAVHSENYYSADVPRLQSFWCKAPPAMGGETAIFQMADAYADVPSECREKLESAEAHVRSWPLSSVAERYGLSEEATAQCIEDFGLPITAEGAVVLRKPSVWIHPETGRRALQINLSVELEKFDIHVRGHFLPQYGGLRWALHRLAWRQPAALMILSSLQSAPFALRLHAKMVASALRGETGMPPKQHDPASLRNRLSAHDVRAIADAVCRHAFMVRWKRGDFLLLDNLQMAHCGMPGLGRRELRVILGNPIEVTQRNGSGVLHIDVEREHATLDSRLRSYPMQRKIGSFAQVAL